MPIIPGTSGNDDINGTAIEDTITAGAGDDLINGGAGDDVIYGDSGNSLSAGGEGVPGDTLGDGPGSTGGGYDRLVGQPRYDNLDFTSDAFYLGNDIPYLDNVNDEPFEGTTFSQDGSEADRAFSMDEIAFENGSRSFVGVISIEESDSFGSDATMASSLTGPQEIVKIADLTVHFTMNDGATFNNIRMYTVQDEDGNTFMVPSDGPTPTGFNAFRQMLATNDSGIASFVIHTAEGDNNGAIIVGGDWADGQILETEEGDGGDDTIIGGEGADQMFGEGGDDTFVVSSAADGAGDVISGGYGPDENTDNDVLDLTGAGPVTIDATADANDAGAQSGTVTFADGSTLTFEGIETIIQDPAEVAPDANDDAVTIDEDAAPVTIDVLANDTDPQGDPLTVVGATVPEDQGTVAVVGNQVVFTPATDFNGDATITYTVEDPDGNQDTAEVAVTVTPVEDAPVTEDDTAATDEDTPVTIDPLANDSDPDGQPLAIAGIPTSPNGTVTVNPDNTIEFTPDPDFNGPTTIDYIAVDPDGNETPGQITVDVAPVVDPDGVVDGLDDGELMNPGYTDPQGDEIDGDDGLDDVIEGNGGDDTINAGLGDDTVSGGDDDDLIDGQEGDDVLTGDAGMDTIDGGDGNDDIDGGDEADVLTGGDGDDVLNGEDGDDDIAVGGADTANGGLGDDVFTVDPTDTNPEVDVTIDGGSDGTTGDPAGPENGDEGDILDLSDQLGDLEVVLEPNPESGTVDGLDADGLPDITFDEIEQIETGLGDDLIDGTDAEAPVDAAGNEGEDTLLGGDGDDMLDGGDDDDLLDGGDGDDSLVGDDGTDTLTGGIGADTLDGGLDDDDLFVGAGDTALGGAGDDEFYVDPALTGTDDITVVGGEESEDLSDPANGGDGDTLDLRGLGEVDVVYNEDDPTFDPETGVSESGTATYTNDDGQPVTINFSEIEDVLADVIDQTPVTEDDTAEVDEDDTVTIDVLGNDTDPNGDPLTVVDATAPNGTVTINPDGTLEYTPDPDFNGEDTITYTVEDPDGNAATGEVAVTVDPVNDAPVAEDDSAGTGFESSVTIDVLDNDTDPENDPLTVTEATAPNGTVTINRDGTLEYTPDAGFDGEDTITYTVEDPGGATSTAEVAVTVAPAEDVAPVANPDMADVDEGTVGIIDVLGNDTDPQDDPLTVVDADADNGIVDINPDGTLSYEPDEGFTGEDTITYTITDPDGNESTSTVTVTVNEVPVDNSDPVATDDVYEIDLEGYEGGNIRLTRNDDRLQANDTDSDGDALRVIEGNDDPNLRQWFPADNGGEIRITSSGAVRFRDVDGDFADLPDGEVQATSITYTVSDGQGGFDEATITVNVTGAALVENQTPDAVDDTASVDAGSVVTIPVLANDTDPQGDPLTVVDADAPNGIVDINPDGTLSYEPDEGFTGEDTITYTITDPDGNTDTAVVTVAVNEGDQTPVVVDDTADVDEDTPVTIDVLGNDTDPNGDPLTVVDATAPNGTVTINPDGTLEYTPDPDFNGEDTITYTVEDPDGNAATGEVAVTVDPVNDAPVAEDDTSATIGETPVTIDVLANDTDVDGDLLTVVDAEAENGIVDINPDGTLEYTADAGFDGEDTITYTISDGELTSTATVAVTVGQSDLPPVVVDDTAEVDEDGTVTIDVLSNDSDPNGDPLTVVDATAPNGTVTINSDGTLEYTPDPDFNGEDTITYTVEDPDGNAATGEVAVTVDPVNDAPVAEDDSAGTGFESSVTIDVLDNDTDPENDPLTVTEATAPNGTVTINRDGTLEYTPDAGFDGEDIISYTISDGELTSTASVIVTVEPETTGGDGVVDGTDGGEFMSAGYDDGEGDQIDGTDGDDDVIEGNGGDDTIDGGFGDDEIDGGDGDDVIRGGDGNDTIEGSEGTDDILGGAGDDTYQGDDEGHVVVYVDNEGNGDVTKYPSQEVDAVNSIENFSGAEIEGENDKISFTTAVSENSIEEDIQGLDDNATGYFFPADGNFINFGPENDYTLSDIFSGTSPDGELPAIGPVGEYFVNGGTEDGQVGDISFENFEQIFFTIEEAPEEEEDIMQLISNGETLDETMPLDEEIEDEEDLLMGM